MSKPKLVSLDTSTWGRLARVRASDPHARKLIEFLSSGDCLPYFTWHHLAELLSHGAASVVGSRIELIRSLKFVVYPRPPGEQAHIGSILNLREAEIQALLQQPTLSHVQVIESARPAVTNGFASGQELCEQNEEGWRLYQQYLSSEDQKRKSEIAALTHFSTADLDEPIPQRGQALKVRPPKEAGERFAQMAKELTTKLQKGFKNKSLPNAEALSYGLMGEAYRDGMGIYGQDQDGFEWLLKTSGVERVRLPPKATIADFGDEAVFVKHLTVHEERLKLPTGTLIRAIRKEALPSWVVWNGINRATRRLPFAESGNVNDRFFAGFGLYVDHVQFDKRVRNFIEELARKSELFETLRRRLIRSTDFRKILSELQAAQSRF